MIRLVYSVLFLLIGIAGFSQTNSETKYVFVKFDTYSVADDKLIQSQITNEKVVYTCIPSGIIVFEVNATDKLAESRISNEIKKASGIPSFTFTHDLTLTDAENSCKTLRLPDNN